LCLVDWYYQCNFVLPVYDWYYAQVYWRSLAPIIPIPNY
jgi:hypothetical protein